VDFLDYLKGATFSQNLKPVTVDVAKTGGVIDTNDYEGKIAILVNVTKGDAAEVVTPSLTHCATSGGSYTAATNGTFTPTALTYEDGVMVCVVDASANLRYLKPVLTPTGTTPVPVAGITVIGKLRLNAAL
jgi:hypothetical protein